MKLLLPCSMPIYREIHFFKLLLLRMVPLRFVRLVHTAFGGKIQISPGRIKKDCVVSSAGAAACC